MFMLNFVICTSDVASLGWGGGDVHFHVNLRHTHIWRHVTGLGGLMRCGDYLSLPYHGVSRPDPTAMLTQNWCEASGCGNGVGQTPRPRVFWSSLVAPWRTVWQCKVEQNTAHLFRNKFPVNYRSSSKNHFKFPGNFKPILGNESVVSLWRKRHLFSKRSKRWHGFPPVGMFMLPKRVEIA